MPQGARKSLFFLIAVTILTFAGCGNQNSSEILTSSPPVRADRELVLQNTVNKAANTSKGTAVVKKEKENKEKPLLGFNICIDAGHGQTKNTKRKEPIAPGAKIMKAANASGTSGVSTKISEESLNLTVSKKLKKALTDKGASIVMIRETHNCDLTNVERAKIWNSSGVDLTIRIHGNGSNNSKTSGVLMMVPGDKYIKNKEMLKKSEQAGKDILAGVLKQTKAKSLGVVKTSELTGFNWSTTPVVLLEMGFMTNPQEDKLLNTDSYQNKLVAGIVEGIEKYKRSLK